MWWIQSVYVHPEYRKQGLFKTLYAHVRAEAIKEGVCKASTCAALQSSICAQHA